METKTDNLLREAKKSWEKMQIYLSFPIKKDGVEP